MNLLLIMNVLIKNVKIWKWRSFCPQDTFPKDNGEVVDGMYLIIKSGKIHVIDREPFPEDNFDSVIDCEGSLLLPGLIGMCLKQLLSLLFYFVCIV